MKRKKTVLLIALVLIIISGGIYFYYGFLFKGARNIASEKPEISITAATLIDDYNSDPQKADLQYLNKTIELNGIVTKETDSTLILKSTVFCLFNQKLNSSYLNTKVVVKGKCIGYDELFQEVKLDQCTIIKTK
nr:hypothetical protein [uncultured Flavobacterium sp.]